MTLRDCSPAEATLLVAGAVAAEALGVHLCNAYTLTLAAKDERLRDVLTGRSLNLVDGTPVTWYYRALTGGTLSGPVRGPSFMRRCSISLASATFYTAERPGLAQMTQRIAEEHPSATVVGKIAPPFRELGDKDIAELVTGCASRRRTSSGSAWVLRSRMSYSSGW